MQNLSERVFPVGRLDYNTEDLLLLTNDGALAQALMHLVMKLIKLIWLKFRALCLMKNLISLRMGVKLEDSMTAPAIVNLRTYDHEMNYTLFDISIHEGRNRQVRRM